MAVLLGYPAGTDGVVDLGLRHFVRASDWLVAGEPPTAWLWWHDCPAVEHVSWGWFGRRVDGSASGHVIACASPLEVTGSLVCTDCGDHGWIRGGVWVPC